ncbi:MAG: AbgT family transporter [Bacteroides sp.]|nr:AbgT family transporter [Bacteroides sp.]
MKQLRIHTLHSATIFFWLTLVVIFLSWICNVYGWSIHQHSDAEAMPVQNLLSAEGIRWMLRNVVTNFATFPPLGRGVVALWGVGIMLHSGLWKTLLRQLGISRRGESPVSRKEKRALLAALTSGAGCLLLILWSTFSRHAILLSAMGSLRHSPFADGSVFLAAFCIGLMGTVYGVACGRYRTDSDVINGLMYPLPLFGIYLLVCFFASQFFAGLEYSRLICCLPVPHLLHYLPIPLALWEYIKWRKAKK